VPDLPLLTAYLDEAYRQLAAATGVSEAHRKTA
jgi:hypothetical protein